MKFKAIIKVKLAESFVELECAVRNTYEESCTDGEISKAIWENEFIDCRIVEV